MACWHTISAQEPEPSVPLVQETSGGGARGGRAGLSGQEGCESSDPFDAPPGLLTKVRPHAVHDAEQNMIAGRQAGWQKAYGEYSL